ncbi:hypothetical protein [Reinekea sp. G2M2-21]|nr:hypothetical protein [Reinekea sp. G2M2-21]
MTTEPWVTALDVAHHLGVAKDTLPTVWQHRQLIILLPAHSFLNI